VGNQSAARLQCLHLVIVIMHLGRHETITKIDDCCPENENH